MQVVEDFQRSDDAKASHRTSIIKLAKKRSFVDDDDQLFKSKF